VIVVQDGLNNILYITSILVKGEIDYAYFFLGTMHTHATSHDFLVPRFIFPWVYKKCIFVRG